MDRFRCHQIETSTEPASAPASFAVGSFAYIPAFDFRPDPKWAGGYVSNVAKDEKHDAQRNRASGA